MKETSKRFTDINFIFVLNILFFWYVYGALFYVFLMYLNKKIFYSSINSIIYLFFSFLEWVLSCANTFYLVRLLSLCTDIYMCIQFCKRTFECKLHIFIWFLQNFFKCFSYIWTIWFRWLHCSESPILIRIETGVLPSSHCTLCNIFYS